MFQYDREAALAFLFKGAVKEPEHGVRVGSFIYDNADP